MLDPDLFPLFTCDSYLSMRQAEEKSLDATYTRMLQMVKTYHGRTRLKTASFKVVKKLRWPLPFNIEESLFLENVFRDESSPVQRLITWVPAHERAARGSTTATFLKSLLGILVFRTFKILKFV